MNYEELTLAGIDVKELLDRFMNNTALVKLVITKFLADNTLSQLKDAVAQGDMKAAEFACHSLKGVCGNLSLKQLFAMLQSQLALFRSGQAAEACAMTQDICQEYAGAVQHLQLWLSQQ